jgi:hypothetical protein
MLPSPPPLCCHLCRASTAAALPPPPPPPPSPSPSFLSLSSFPPAKTTSASSLPFFFVDCCLSSCNCCCFFCQRPLLSSSSGWLSRRHSSCQRLPATGAPLPLIALPPLFPLLSCLVSGWLSSPRASHQTDARPPAPPPSVTRWLIAACGPETRTKTTGVTFSE